MILRSNANCFAVFNSFFFAVYKYVYFVTIPNVYGIAFDTFHKCA